MASWSSSSAVWLFNLHKIDSSWEVPKLSMLARYEVGFKLVICGGAMSQAGN
jgi:hypothetical protein